MPKFSVDVKAFINIEVEAENEREARAKADAFVETIGLDDVPSISPGGFVVDGVSDVEDISDDEICSQCWDQQCDGCVPPDTPSLDTSFHHHEMNV